LAAVNVLYEGAGVIELNVFNHFFQGKASFVGVNSQIDCLLAIDRIAMLRDTLLQMNAESLRILVLGNHRLYFIGSRLVDPGVSPFFEVLALQVRELTYCLLETINEVSGLSVLVFELSEVGLRPRHECLLANVVLQGLNETGALLVADFIKDIDCVNRVLNIHLDGVSH
jgi:hypothetical protein